MNSSNNPSTDRLVQDYYQRQQLPEHLREAMKDRIISHQTSEARPSRTLRFPRRTVIALSGVAALLMIAVGLTIILQTQNMDTTERIVQHVSEQYLHRTDADFRTCEADHLAQDFSELDFRPILSQRITQRNLRVYGARYCVLGDRQALHIRLKDDAGRDWTLYQTVDAKQFASTSDREFIRNGYRIDTWRENGLFLALAGPVEQKI